MGLWLTFMHLMSIICHVFNFKYCLKFISCTSVIVTLQNVIVFKCIYYKYMIYLFGIFVNTPIYPKCFLALFLLCEVNLTFFIFYSLLKSLTEWFKCAIQLTCCPAKDYSPSWHICTCTSCVKWLASSSHAVLG